MSQPLKIQMDSVPKLRFDTVESTPENKIIANQLLQEKLVNDDHKKNIVNFFDAVDVWNDIKGVRALPLELAIKNNSQDKDTTYESLIDRSFTVCDTIPKDGASLEELIRKSVIKRLAYETITYGTRYYIQANFYENIHVENVTQRMYKHDNFVIQYFLAEVKVNRMLIRKPY